MTVQAPDLFRPTLDEQLACVEREIEMRQRVYPNWIKAGRMTQKKADKELNVMRQVSVTLHRLIVAERGQRETKIRQEQNR